MAFDNYGLFEKDFLKEITSEENMKKSKLIKYAVPVSQAIEELKIEALKDIFSDFVAYTPDVRFRIKEIMYVVDHLDELKSDILELINDYTELIEDKDSQ